MEHVFFACTRSHQACGELIHTTSGMASILFLHYFHFICMEKECKILLIEFFNLLKKIAQVSEFNGVW